MEHSEDPPTGLPADDVEPPPLGADDTDPDGEGEPARGPDAMPGIPADGEPPQSG